MKSLIFFVIIFLCIPTVWADDDCGLLNLASCIPQKIYEFVLSIINSPIQFLLSMMQSLMVEPVQLSLFAPIWGITLYIVSLFYGILVLYAGFMFILSGHDPRKRMEAKEWLQNVVLIIVLANASYYLYGLVLDIATTLTAGVLQLTGNDFFLLSIDNLPNLGLEFLFGFTYVLVLIVGVLLLAIRYIIVAAGVGLLPLAILLYFVPALSEYGKLILNFLGSCILLTFFNALIFLACAKSLSIPLFASIKILIMIGAFGVANLLMLYVIIFSALKSVAKAVIKVKILGAAAHLAA